MPWTLSHAAAVLPLRRYCPRPLNLAALVVGSFAPDLGDYLGQFDLVAFAHTFAGSLLVSWPSGLFLLLLFYLLRKPLWFVLPNPHRAALAPLCAKPPPFGWRAGGCALLSLLFGVWTHTFWDAWTHEEGWFAQRLACLRRPLWTADGVTLHVAYLLQEISTLLGVALLVIAYWLWLRRRSGSWSFAAADKPWRYWFWGGTVAITALVSIPVAAYVALTSKGQVTFRVFLFFGAICAAIVGFCLTAVGSSVMYALRDTEEDELPGNSRILPGPPDS